MVLRSNRHDDEASYWQKIRAKLETDIDELIKYSLLHDTKAIKKKFQEIVPEYTPQENEAVL
jgi:hypothetical protein